MRKIFTLNLNEVNTSFMKIAIGIMLKKLIQGVDLACEIKKKLNRAKI